MKLSPEQLDALTAGYKTPKEMETLYSQMLQHMINRSLEAEMQAHLGGSGYLLWTFTTMLDRGKVSSDKEQALRKLSSMPKSIKSLFKGVDTNRCASDMLSTGRSH